MPQLDSQIGWQLIAFIALVGKFPKLLIPPNKKSASQEHNTNVQHNIDVIIFKLKRSYGEAQHVNSDNALISLIERRL